MADGVAGAQAAKALLERDVHARDLARLEGCLDHLLMRLAGDTLALGKIELMRDGIDDAAVQAERLGCTVPEIYRASERIAYHAALVKKAAARKETDAPEARA